MGHRHHILFTVIITVFLTAQVLVTGCASDEQKAESFISEADAYFQNNEFDKALIQLKNAVKHDPKSLKAHTLMARVYVQLKDIPNAYKTDLRIEQLAPDNIDVKIELAGFNLLGKNYDEAGQRITAVLEKEPANIKALYLKAGLMAREKKPVETIERVYRQILDADAEQERAHFALAGLLMAQKNAQEAETHLLAAKQINPKGLNIYRALYGLYRSTSRLDKAQALLEQMVEAMPGNADALVMLGSHYLGQGNREKGLGTLEQAIAADPATIKPHLVIARYYNRENQPEKAEEYIKKALVIDPDSHELKLLYADFQFNHNNLDPAEALVDEILAQRHGYPLAKALKGRILVRRNKLDKAIAIFQDLVKNEPNSGPFNFMLGSALFQNRRPQEGLPYITKSLEVAPGNMAARKILADHYFRTRDFFLAETEITKVLARNPDDYNANILLGNIHAAQKDYDSARVVFERMIKTAPDNPTAFFRLGLVCRAQNNPGEALKHFNDAIRLNPMLMDVFSQIISVHAAGKDYKKALSLCDSQLEKTKETPVAQSIIYNLKAGLFMAQKHQDAAKKALGQAIEANPAYITPYLTLARIYATQDDLTEAVRVYQDLIEQRPDQPAPHSLLGTLYEKQGQPDQAEIHYKKALEITPDFVPAMNNLAFMYAEQGKHLDEALELARKARAKTQNITAIIDTLGWVYYKKELYPSAAEEFETCVEKEPENPVFHYHLGLAYNKMWKYDKARASLEKALALQDDFDGSQEARKILAEL